MEDLEIDKRYLEEISKEGRLQAQEEADLFERIKRGDISAKNKLIKANLRFVKAVSLQFRNRGAALSDLISEGNLGLIHAIKKFDSTKGFRFLSYAGHWINKYIRKAIDKGGSTVSIPPEKIALLKRLEIAEEDLKANLGREPSTEQLADNLGVTEMEILHLKQIPYKSKEYEESLEIGVKRSSPLYDLLYDETRNADYSLLKEEESERLKYLLSTLSKRQRKVIELNFGFGRDESLNLNEISHQLNISPERARQLKEAGLKNLRKKFPLKSR
jgi:RNA polymerase primary sigma factor